MTEEGHIPPRNHGRKEASAPMEYGTPLEILPIEMTFNFPLSLSPFLFTSLWLFFEALTSLWLFFEALTSLLIVFGFLFEQAFATMTLLVSF